METGGRLQRSQLQDQSGSGRAGSEDKVKFQELEKEPLLRPLSFSQL